jgi:lactate racemase
MHGKGSATELLGGESARELLAAECAALPLDGKRVLVLVPDGTRHAPIPLLFGLLYEELGKRVAKLDYLIALGTHPPMPDAAVDKLVGLCCSPPRHMSGRERGS